MPERNPFTPEEEIVPPSENIGETENPSEDEEKLMPVFIEDCQTQEEVTMISEAMQREANEKKLARMSKLEIWWKKVEKLFPTAESGFGSDENDGEVVELLKKFNTKKEEIDDEHEATISEINGKVETWKMVRKEKESNKLHEEIEGI